MEKTIKEWLETLPEPYRTEALENTMYKRLTFMRENLHESILSAFEWLHTTQGHAYWWGICDRAEAGEFNNNSLDKDTGKL